MRRQTMMEVVGLESDHTKSPLTEQEASLTSPTRTKPVQQVGVDPGPPVAAAIRVSATMISQPIPVNPVRVRKPAATRQEMRKVGVATAQEMVMAAIRQEVRRVGVEAVQEVVVGQEVGVVAVLAIKMEMVIRKGAITTKVGVAQVQMIKATARWTKSQRMGVVAAKRNPRTAAASHMTRVESHATRVGVAVLL